MRFRIRNRAGGYGLVLELAGAVLSGTGCEATKYCVQYSVGMGNCHWGVNRAGLSLFLFLFGHVCLVKAGDGGVELSRPARRSPHAPRGSKGRRMRAALGALNCLGIEDVCGSRTVRGSSRNRQSVVRPLSLVARSFVCETCAPNLFGQLLRQCQMRMPDRARIRLSTLKSHPSRPLPVVLREQGCGCVAAPVKRFPIREGVGM
jgi:hypothetical protein